MSERRRQIIEMLNVLKRNSYSGNPQAARDFTIIKDCKKASFDFVIDQAARDFTIIKDCKKASFDFVIDQAIAYIHDPLNLLYYDTDSVEVEA